MAAAEDLAVQGRVVAHGLQGPAPGADRHDLRQSAAERMRWTAAMPVAGLKPLMPSPAKMSASPGWAPEPTMPQ